MLPPESPRSSSLPPQNAIDGDTDLPDAPPIHSEQDGVSSPLNPDTANKLRQDGPVDLENLFDADSSDEEALNGSSRPPPGLESSSPPLSPASSPPVVSVPEKSIVAPTDPELMLQYYGRLFPFRIFFHWLNHSVKPGRDFSDREFAFTLSNDAYLRYQSYPTADLLRRDILRLNPSRFEIGPVYTMNPRDRKSLLRKTSATSAFKPIAKELVFDIDLTDYDDIRTCCEKANICAQCWTWVTMAIKVIDVALREDFGFQHIMWVYSGRRGAHAWISDRVAREMDDDKRRSLAGYLEVIKGGAGGAHVGGNGITSKRVNVKRPLHPHLTRSLEILKPYFSTAILQDQDPFLSPRGSDRLLSLLPQDTTFLNQLRAKWSSDPNRPSQKKWSDIDAVASTGVSDTLSTRALRDAKQDILLEYTYPRLDVEVSKKRIHLLKSPFVVHPGTGRVCVPITADAQAASSSLSSSSFSGSAGDPEAFDPLAVPTLSGLLTQLDSRHPLNEHTPNNEDNKNINNNNSNQEEDDIMTGFTPSASGAGKVRKLHDWEKTDLRVYVDRFDGFVKKLLRAENMKSNGIVSNGNGNGNDSNGSKGKRAREGGGDDDYGY